MSKRAYLLFAVLLLTLVGAAGTVVWLTFSVPVQIARPARGPAVQAVYATGVVEPVNWAKVAPTGTGRLVEIAARDGAAVRRGDLLAKLDDREAQALLKELEAVEGFRKDELERYARLAKTSIASRQAFERTASEHARAVAAVAAARQRVRDLTLLAPMDGVVLRQDGEVGEVVETGEILFWIGRNRPLWIEAEVDEEDIPLIAVGQRAAIKADAFPRRNLDGAVREITPKGDPISKNYRVRISLPDDTPLLIGMTTEVNIVVQVTDNALLVPAGAVQVDHVWVVQGDRVQRRPVIVGIRGETMFEIAEGLDDGETIVLDPPEILEDGDRVRVNDTAPDG